VKRLALVAAAVAAVVVAGAGTAAPAPLPGATYAFGARAGAPALRLRAGQQLPGFTGGPVTGASGEMVTIYVQNELLAADPSTPQRFADLLTSLVHGPELSKLNLYLGTLDNVHRLCGSSALGCYNPSGSTIVAIGQDLRGVAARSIVTHEYGHHVAANRSNDPWSSVDWGTKRWASYENVCKRSKAGELFPGDESENYQLNPGEDFAETYRVMNEKRAGVAEMPWLVVDPSLYPDQTALDLLAQDVTTPWAGPATSTIQSSFTARGSGRGFRLQTPLDGSFSVTMHGPARSNFTLRVVDLASGAVLGSAASATASKSVSFELCGQRSVQIQVKRVRGSGAFSLVVTQP
jgi:hypothetical protein